MLTHKQAGCDVEGCEANHTQFVVWHEGDAYEGDKAEMWLARGFIEPRLPATNKKLKVAKGAAEEVSNDG